MTYLDTIENEFRVVLSQGDTETVVAWVKERVLESFRNGVEAGKKKKRSPGKRSQN